MGFSPVRINPGPLNAVDSMNGAINGAPIHDKPVVFVRGSNSPMPFVVKYAPAFWTSKFVARPTSPAGSGTAAAQYVRIGIDPCAQKYNWFGAGPSCKSFHSFREPRYVPIPRMAVKLVNG